MNKTEVPVVGQTYYFFNDGKITMSRRSEIIITHVIPFDEIDDETLESWQQEVQECDFLYAKETDYFVKALCDLEDDNQEHEIFVRTIEGDWFSLGWLTSGALDVDGSLNEILMNY